MINKIILARSVCNPRAEAKPRPIDIKASQRVNKKTLPTINVTANAKYLADLLLDIILML